MGQPAAPVISANFQAEEASLVAGRSTLRTSALDATLDSIVESIAQLIASIFLIQRDDGEIRDGTVKVHTLAADVLALISSSAFVVRGEWISGTVYVTGDLVSQSGIAYLCFVAHTADIFATDLAAAYWVSIPAGASAVNVTFSPTSTISSTNAQAAIEEVDSELRVSTRLFLDQTMGGL